MSLDNPNRLRAKELVSLFPGIHLRELQRLLRASFNTTRYHVQNLERTGEVLRWDSGGHSRLYPAGFDLRARGLYAVLHNRTTRHVLRTLVSAGRSGNGEVAAATGLPKSTVSEQFDLLCAAGLVSRSSLLGAGYVYEVRDKENVAETLALFERNLLTVAADSFVDLWDF
jgi:predicted transcriptional regulator